MKRTLVALTICLLTSTSLYALGGNVTTHDPIPDPQVITEPSTSSGFLDPAKWSVRYSQKMPNTVFANPGGGWYFDFPKGTNIGTSVCTGKDNCPGVHYVTRPYGQVINYGSYIVVTGEITTTGTPVFNYKLEKTNTCTAEATARVMVQKRNDDMYSSNGRFWSNPIGIVLKGGKFTVTIPMTIDNWSNVSGNRDQSGFKNLLNNMGNIGLTFGGGCFYGHGVNVSDGTARFILTGFSIQATAGEPTPLPPPPPPPPSPPPPPPPPSPPPPPPGGSVDPALTTFFSEREGWGKDTTGGAAGTMYHVTSLADSGAGTLRDALTRPEPLWIVFDVEGTITLTDSITLTSNKTVDGRGKNVNVKVANHQGRGFQFSGSDNIIVVGMKFDDGWPNYTTDDEGSDGFNIENSSNIWIHHNTFNQWRDGDIDMKGGVSNVSITWNKFTKTYQGLNFTADKVSFGHNYCSQLVARCIQALNGKVHSYNNLIASWGKESIQNAKDNAQIYSQYNIWNPGGFNSVNSRVNGGKIANKNHHQVKPTNFVGGNDSLTAPADGANITKCSDTTCWNNLKNTLETKTGDI